MKAMDKKILTAQDYIEDFIERTRYYMDEKDTDVISPMRFGEMFGALECLFNFGFITSQELQNYRGIVWKMYFEAFPWVKSK